MHTRVTRTHWLAYVAAIVALFVASPPVQATTTLRIGHVGNGQGAIHAGAERFAQHLADVSGGEMEVEIIGRGALGNIPELWVQMQAEALDMQVIDTGAISLLESGKPIQVLLTPFLFESQAHLRRYMKSPLARSLLDDIAVTSGIRYLGHVGERSPRVISTTHRPIVSVADLRGMEMRVPRHPMFIEIFDRWGSIATPVQPSDMFMALKSGLVDGEDNGIVTLASGSNASIIRHVTPINWNRSVVALWISDKRWQSLTDQQRSWIDDAVSRSEFDAAAAFDIDMRNAREKLDELGIEIHKPELGGFKAIVEDFVDAHEGTIWPNGEVERIRALR